MDQFPYLFAGTAIVWVVIFVYLWGVDRRSRDTARDLEALKRQLEGDAPPD